jgi:hypothetical protein
MIEKKIHKYDEGFDKPIPPDEPQGDLLKSVNVPPKEEPQAEIKKEEVQPQEIIKEPTAVSEPGETLATLLAEIFGMTSFERIRNDGLMMVPFTDAQTPMDSWLSHWVRMMFKPDEAISMVQSCNNWLQKKGEGAEHLQQELARYKTRYAEMEAQTSQLESAFQNADAEKKQLRRDLLTSISAVYLIDKVMPKGASATGDTLSSMLKDEMMNPVGDYPEFVIGFLEGWEELSKLLTSVEDSEEGMAQLHLALTNLLDKISGKVISRRRSMLDVLAVACSSKFKLYKFISPEESLQVDPRIHSATALGGSTIKEGISFAVIKKDTMQTVKYAEIRV